MQATASDTLGSLRLGWTETTIFNIASFYAGESLDGGAGNDSFDFGLLDQANLIRGGAGSDQVFIASGSATACPAMQVMTGSVSVAAPARH